MTWVPKVHLVARSRLNGRFRLIACCGALRAVRLTNERDKVTCASCLRFAGQEWFEDRHRRATHGTTP